MTSHDQPVLENDGDPLGQAHALQLIQFIVTRNVQTLGTIVSQLSWPCTTSRASRLSESPEFCSVALRHLVAAHGAGLQTSAIDDIEGQLPWAGPTVATGWLSRGSLVIV